MSSLEGSNWKRKEETERT